MTVLMRSEVPGITADQADALMTPLLNLLKAFPGFIAHASGPVPGGYGGIEVWESQEAHERWLREVIVPNMRQAGLTEPLPPSQYLPLDRFVTRDTAE
ncbi:MAG TPA: hypothetical protein VGR57_19325 [Ktedonobacterales bacterium]|nr:hypothetical protein [Ktedonobacterales bacterium]